MADGGSNPSNVTPEPKLKVGFATVAGLKIRNVRFKVVK